MLQRLVTCVLGGIILVSAGCSSSPPPGEAPKTPFASAIIAPTAGNKCNGSIAFTQQGTRVRVVADLHGLTPGKKHGIHILEAFSCSVLDSTTLNYHFNPDNNNHGLPPHGDRHAGDLGNALANSSGDVHYELTISNFSVSDKDPVVGRAVVVHSGMDDGANPVGNAGTAIGCGVIQGR